jgi:hypothetical protein
MGYFVVSSAFLEVTHVIGGALLLASHVKSRKLLGLKPIDALNTAGIVFYVLSVLSVPLLGAGTLSLLFYLTAIPWLGSLVTGTIMGVVACKNACSFMRRMDGPPEPF